MTCRFSNGLDALAETWGEEYFSLCIDMPRYDITIGGNKIIDN